MPAPSPAEPDPDIVESSPRWGRAASPPGRVPRWVMLTAAGALLAVGGTVLGLGHEGRAAPARPVAHVYRVPAACGQYVNGTSRRADRRLRIVLGDVALPPAYLPLGVSGRSIPWQYGEKTGIQYRGGGPPVTISVPAAWQHRIGLFGPPNGPGGVASTVHIPSCPPRGAWDTFVTAFYVSTPHACAPLRVQVGLRSVTAWFGLGRRCPARMRLIQYP